MRECDRGPVTKCFGSGISCWGVHSLYKAREFVLGYVNELGEMAKRPGLEEFRYKGTYLSLRKLRQKVALFRRFLAEEERTPEGAEWLTAKTPKVAGLNVTDMPTSWYDRVSPKQFRPEGLGIH